MNKTTGMFRNYRVSAVTLHNKRAPFSDAKYENWNYHKVTVTNTATRQRCTFDFWASLAHPEIRNHSDLRDALSCFISDATCACGSFEDFCAEFGYETDSRKAEQTYRACQRAKVKAERVMNTDLYVLADELNA